MRRQHLHLYYKALNPSQRATIGSKGEGANPRRNAACISSQIIADYVFVGQAAAPFSIVAANGGGGNINPRLSALLLLDFRLAGNKGYGPPMSADNPRSRSAEPLKVWIWMTHKGRVEELWRHLLGRLPRGAILHIRSGLHGLFGLVFLRVPAGVAVSFGVFEHLVSVQLVGDFSS